MPRKDSLLPTDVKWTATTCPGLCSPPSQRFALPWASTVYLFAVLVESIAACSFAFWIIAEEGSGGASHAAAAYAVLSIYLVLSFAYFSANAVYAENEFQLVAAILVSGLFTGFIAFKFADRNWGDIWEQWALVVLITKVAFQVLYVALAYSVTQGFGRRGFKTVGANIKLRALYRTYLTMLSLLKADVFLGLFLIVLSWFFLRNSVTVLVVQVVALVFTIVWALVVWGAIVRESDAVLRGALMFVVVEPVYVIYKLLQLYVLGDDQLLPNATPVQFVVVGSIALITRALLTEHIISCYRNFGKGLKPKVFFRATKGNAMADYGALQPSGNA